MNQCIKKEVMPSTRLDRRNFYQIDSADVAYMKQWSDDVYVSYSSSS